MMLVASRRWLFHHSAAKLNSIRDHRNKVSLGKIPMPHPIKTYVHDHQAPWVCHLWIALLLSCGFPSSVAEGSVYLYTNAHWKCFSSI